MKSILQGFKRQLKGESSVPSLHSHTQDEGAVRDRLGRAGQGVLLTCRLARDPLRSTWMLLAKDSDCMKPSGIS